MAVEVYVPVDGLQGQVIPGHVLWGTEQVESIVITAGPQFSGLEAFNADPEGTSQENNTWTFTRFQRPGYLGFILKTRRIESLDSAEMVNLVVTVDGKRVSHDKPVRLFRPSLAILEPPKSISVDKEGTPSHTLRLQRSGHGTLFVSVDTVEDSAVKSIIPEELIHAVEGFATDFAKGLELLRPKYPALPHVFDPIPKDELQDREALARRLTRVIEDVGENADLSADLQELFARSLIQNSDFESLFFAPLLDFISSIVSGGTILAMPWLEFEVPKGKSILDLSIEAKDVLGEVVFKETLQPIEVTAPVETVLSLSKLISWGGTTTKERQRYGGKRGPYPVKPSERRARGR